MYTLRIKFFQVLGVALAGLVSGLARKRLDGITESVVISPILHRLVTDAKGCEYPAEGCVAAALFTEC